MVLYQGKKKMKHLDEKSKDLNSTYCKQITSQSPNFLTEKMEVTSISQGKDVNEVMHVEDNSKLYSSMEILGEVVFILVISLCWYFTF